MATTTPEPAATRAEVRKLYTAKFAKQLEAIDKKIRKAASSGDHGVLIDGYGFENVTTSQTRQSMPEEPAAIMAMLEERGFDVQVSRTILSFHFETASANGLSFTTGSLLITHSRAFEYPSLSGSSFGPN